MAAPRVACSLCDADAPTKTFDGEAHQDHQEFDEAIVQELVDSCIPLAKDSASSVYQSSVVGVRVTNVSIVLRSRLIPSVHVATK